MRLGPIVERLKAQGFKRVYGALELAALKTSPAQLPAYFVVPDNWSAEPNRTSGVHDQLIREAFGVVIALAPKALREDQASDEIHAEELRVLAATVGWTHPDASRACEAVRGQMVSVSGNALCWMVSLSTGRHIRIAP